jgi:hypothetical protein
VEREVGKEGERERGRGRKRREEFSHLSCHIISCRIILDYVMSCYVVSHDEMKVLDNGKG